MAETSQEGFYDEAYYRSHYGRVHDDPAYHRLRGLYWKHALFDQAGLQPKGPVLDFGCGLGPVSAALDEVEAYDFSAYARNFVRKLGRTVYDDPAEIPDGRFDVILSSHCLEHSLTPHEDLKQFARWARPGGRLVLVLPVEINLAPATAYDNDRHMQAWTFQTITNLLLASGWQPRQQCYVYDSLGLGKLAQLFGEERAVALSWKLGRLARNFKSLYTIAEKTEAST